MGYGSYRSKRSLITYKVETVAECIEEIKPLNLQHWEEVATNKEVRPLEPDYDKYYTLEELGMLRILTARDGDVLVGYFITMLCQHMHYKSCTTAMNDILYIHPDYRKSTIGFRLFKVAIADLKDNTDATLIVVHMKITHPFRKLLKHFDFKLAEENWELQL